MKINKASLITLMVTLFCLLFAGCVPGGGSYDRMSPAGFLSGIWHGWIAPVSLILGIFDKSIRIYEPNNVGWLYDLGFYIAIIGGFGGINLTRTKLKKRPKRES
jgi:hypothetical protein